jgi:hypothetical protein
MDFSQNTNLVQINKKIFNNLGAKYIGSRKGEVGSLLGRVATEQKIKQMEDNLGDGMYFVTYNDARGKPIANTTFEDDFGNVVKTDARGSVRYVDGGFISQVNEVEDEIEKEVDNKTEMAGKSDNICEMLLGKERWAWCAENGGPASGMHPNMKKLDCRPSYIKSLPSGDILQTQSISKLRWIVRHSLDDMNVKGAAKTQTNDKVVEDRA